MLEKYRGSNLRSQSPLEQQCHSLFTPFAFQKFQEEFARATQYMVQEITYNIFIVKYYKGIQINKHQVVWDGKVAKCSCKNFEFIGILCRHILSVLLHKDCFNIPLAYWPSRWKREEDSQSHELEFVNSTLINNDEAVTDVIDLVQCPPTSKTKGPQRKAIEGWNRINKASKSV